MSKLLGPAAAFAHVTRASDGTTVFEGAARWEGGTRVREGTDDCGGVFAGWEWNGEELRLCTDRLGLFPLFVWDHGDGCCVSPSIATLLARGAPPELDLDAVGIFLRLGYFLGDDTPFRSIRAVPALRSSTIAPGRRTECRWSEPTHEIAITRTAAIDEYIERFRAAVARRLPDRGVRFFMPLSGGSDSRHILLELARHDRLPEFAVTATQRPGAYDVEVARELCLRCGLGHSPVVGRMDAGWRAELRKNRLTSFCADEHVWYLPVAERIAASSPLTYDGILGDILSAQVDLTEPVLRGMRTGRVDELLADVLSESHEEGVRDALRPELLRRIPFASTRDRVAAELEAVLDQPNPWAAFHVRHWERREITLNPHSVLGRMTVHTPFADGDVVRFLTALPPDLLFGGRFHVDTIHRAFPEHDGIPFARDLPRSHARRVIDRARRIPPRVATQFDLARRSLRSEYLAPMPPVLRRPLPGHLGALNRRLIWLRQVELVARGALAA
ncbi:MAG: hypothetical protein ACXVLZ_07040 [Acidimicrobiia bacterium]